MTEADIYARLTELFHDLFANDMLVLQPTTTAKDVAGWDSFAHLNLIVAVESSFGLKMTSAEIDGLDSVGSLVRVIEAKATR